MHGRRLQCGLGRRRGSPCGYNSVRRRPRVKRLAIKKSSFGETKRGHLALKNTLNKQLNSKCQLFFIFFSASPVALGQGMPAQQYVSGAGAAIARSGAGQGDDMFSQGTAGQPFINFRLEHWLAE